MKTVQLFSSSKDGSKAFIFSLLLMFFIAASTVFAQEKSSEPVYTENISLNSDKDVGYGAETSFLTWHGYINFEYIATQGKKTTFDNHEFYLSARSVLSKRVSLTAEFEYEHTPEKLVLPIQAYADFRAADFLTFRAGLFYTPLGMSRSYNLRGNKNRMIRQVAVIHDIMFENWSEMGLNIFGQFPFGLYYDFAVSNGMPNSMGTGDSWFDAATSLQSHTEDNNDDKAVHGKIGLHSTSFLDGEINTALSFVTQKYDPDATKTMNHYAAEFRFLHSSGLRFQAEYMVRTGDNNPVDYAKGIAANAYGWYAQVSKRFVVKDNDWINYLEPVFQVDYIDLDKNAKTNGDKMTYAIGLIYSPEPYYLIKFEYDIVDEVNGVKVDNNTFWGSVVLEF